jgi:hypothetical protein
MTMRWRPVHTAGIAALLACCAHPVPPAPAGPIAPRSAAVDGDGAVILTSGQDGAQLIVPILDRLATEAPFVAYLRASQ